MRLLKVFAKISLGDRACTSRMRLAHSEAVACSSGLIEHNYCRKQSCCRRSALFQLPPFFEHPFAYLGIGSSVLFAGQHDLRLRAWLVPERGCRYTLAANLLLSADGAQASLPRVEISFQTSSRDLPDVSPTISRHLPDIDQTSPRKIVSLKNPPTQLPDIFQTTPRHSPQIWVGRRADPSCRSS